MMNLTHWRLLLAVAQARNISRAAAQVGITQSGASQAIAQMEQALGAPLLVRERRAIALTAFGERVLQRAHAMLAEFDAIRALADAERGMPASRLRIASFPSVLTTVLLPLVAAFRRRHPAIDVVVLEGTDEEVEQWLEDDTVDLGVVINPAPARRATVIGRDQWLAVVPSSHALARRSAQTGIALHELAHQPFVLATGGCHVHGASLAAQAGVALGDVRVTVRDLASAALLVRDGMGVAIIPASALPADLRGVRALPLAPPAWRAFGLVAAPAARSGRGAQAAQQFLAETGAQAVSG
jgi:DNA-binding transcriptional LysR family regulator